MNNSIKKLGYRISALLLLLLSIEAWAQDERPNQSALLDAIEDGQSMTSFRLRYENVSQDSSNALKDANAFTLRSLIGWQTGPFHDVSVGAQLIGVTDLNHDFNAKQWNVNTAGKSGYAVVQDPDYYNINQLYIDWTAISNTKVRFGQQSLKLDNVRFIGNVEFRQVMQVFSGVTVENKSIPNTDLYTGYYTRLRKATTSQELSEDTAILHATYHLSPAENLVSYGYWYDANNDKFSVTGSASYLNLSNRTVGVRADGAHPINDHWKVLYTAEYAKQDRISNGDPNINSHYYKLGVGGGWDGWFIRADQELLSSNKGLYAFQTPLGTNHLFQGWVDKFAASTPVQGMQDTYLTAGGKWQNFSVLSEYHWFNSDYAFSTGTGTTGNLYGREWDISIAYVYDKQTTAKLEYGTFSEGDYYGGVSGAARYRNTDKIWLTANYNF